MNCRSVHVRATARTGRLVESACRLALNHRGDCTDGEGHRWTRLSELLRQRGLVLVGAGVRRAAA